MRDAAHRRGARRLCRADLGFKRIALYFCRASAVIFAVFLGSGHARDLGAHAALPRPRMPELALAVGNLGAPGGLTRIVVLSLGAGLSLLVAVALANASLVSELQERMPETLARLLRARREPRTIPAITELMSTTSRRRRWRRRRCCAAASCSFNDTPVEDMKAPPEAQWVLNGDRGLIVCARGAGGSKVVAGEWWPTDYSGEPLVSFELELAGKLGLKLGDTVTVNVLGRNVTARIANLREVKWESLAINFVMVFSPNTLKGAPHNLLVTISLPNATPPAAEAQVIRSWAATYPSVTAIRVQDALDAFSSVFAKVMMAVRVAGSVTLLAGALVLAGALATAQRRRILEAVILKTLGATRRRILARTSPSTCCSPPSTAVFAGFGSPRPWLAVTVSWTSILRFHGARWRIPLSVRSCCCLAASELGAFCGRRPVPYLRTE